MYFLAIFFVTQIFHLSGGEPHVVLPQKLTAEQLKKFTTYMSPQDNVRETCWFKEFVEQEKKLVMQEIDSIGVVPNVLLQSIAEYATPYSDVYKRIGSLAIHSIFLSTYDIAIPLRVTCSSHGKTRWWLAYEDVYRAWAQGILNINNFEEWKRLMKSQEPVSSVASLSALQEVPNNTAYMKLDRNLCLHYSSKNILSFALAVYWQNNQKVYLARKSKAIFPRARGAFDTTIRDGCYNILHENKVLAKGVRAKDLIIFCTSCNGRIMNPEKGVEELLFPRHDVHDYSLFCDGQDTRCRTFRALRVFLKPKSSISVPDSCILS